MVPNEPGSRPGTELELRWRSSRHARRLLTLALFGVFLATLARRPEFAGLAAPALLLLAAGRGGRRPPRITVRARPSSRRGFEGELIALDVTVAAAGLAQVAGDAPAGAVGGGRAAGPGTTVEHRQGQAGRWGFTRINRRAGPDGGDRQGRACPAALDG